MQNIKFISVCTPPVSTGSVTFNIRSFNSTPNSSLTITVTGITAGMTEEATAYTICQQASSAFVASGNIFQGVLTTLNTAIPATWQTCFTDHVVSFFCQSQYEITQVSNTTGAKYYIDNCPVFCTVDEALAYGPLANQLLQDCGGGSLSTDDIIDLLAMSSSEVSAVLRNNIVSCFYVYYFTTQMTNAVKFDNTPIQMFYNPYALRPSIMAMATQLASFDLNSRYSVDYTTGWCTFRFAQDLLFNYEPFDMNNQWYVAYQAGWNYIPREIKTATLQWSYVLQVFSNIEEMSDGNSKIKYSVDKNIEKRNIFNKLRKYMQ